MYKKGDFKELKNTSEKLEGKLLNIVISGEEENKYGIKDKRKETT